MGSAEEPSLGDLPPHRAQGHGPKATRRRGACVCLNTWLLPVKLAQVHGAER